MSPWFAAWPLLTGWTGAGCLAGVRVPFVGCDGATLFGCAGFDKAFWNGFAGAVFCFEVAGGKIEVDGAAFGVALAVDAVGGASVGAVGGFEAAGAGACTFAGAGLGAGGSTFGDGGSGGGFGIVFAFSSRNRNSSATI